MEAYIIPQHENRKEDWARQGVLAARTLAERNNCNVTVIVPTKKRADSSLIKHVLSPNQIKLALDGYRVLLDGSVAANVESVRTIQAPAQDSILLLMKVWSEYGHKLKITKNTKAVVVLPPIEQEGKAWHEILLAHTPSVLVFNEG